MRYALKGWPIDSDAKKHNAWHDNLEGRLSAYFPPRALLLLRLWLQDQDFYAHDENIALDDLERHVADELIPVGH